MTLLDGHGRTPHDTLEQTQSAVVMLCCLPCLCVVACVQSVASLVESLRQCGRVKEKSRSGAVEKDRGVELGTPVIYDKEAEASLSEPRP